jgi:hypothetical protein
MNIGKPTVSALYLIFSSLSISPEEASENEISMKKKQIKNIDIVILEKRIKTRFPISQKLKCND